MNARLKAAVVCACLAAVIFAQAPPGARISNFEAPTSDTAGRHSVVKGANAEPAGTGIYKITAPNVRNFDANGKLQSTIDATECFFDYNGTRDVWSDKEFSMRTADGRLALKGVGFRWSSSASQVAVSNKVEAVVRRQALVNPAATNNDTVKITADSLHYQSDLVTFTGNVRAIDPQGEVNARIVKVRFDEKGDVNEIEAIEDVLLTQKQTEARGGRAVYNRLTGLLRLSENTRWRMGDREGQSELLILDRTNETLRAETKVKMSLPSSLIVTNLPGHVSKPSSTNRLTISADAFDYAPTNITTRGPIVIFNGNVQAIDPQAGLDCELLTLFFDQTNRLVRAIADRNVQISRTEGGIKGTRAVFENDEITIPNSPTWRWKENSGSADLLVFNPRTREIRAVKKVRMEIPVSGATNLLLSAAATNNAPPTSSLLIVTADYFTNKNNVATFSENVRASEARGQIDAKKIEVHFNSTNRIERVLAEGDVIITQPKTQATGQRADYDVTAGIIRLTGDPRVVGENATAIASEFVIDLVNHKRQPIAPFRIEVRNIKALK